MAESEPPLLSALRAMLRHTYYPMGTVDNEYSFDGFVCMATHASAHYADAVMCNAHDVRAQVLTRSRVVPSLQAQAAVAIARTCYRRIHKDTPECGCWRNQRMSHVLRRWITCAEAADHVIVTASPLSSGDENMPLRLACKARNIPAIQLLLRMGADAFARDMSTRKTAIHDILQEVAKDGEKYDVTMAITKALLFATPKARYQGDVGVDILHFMVRSGLNKCIVMLLDVYPDLNINARYDGNLAMEIAITCRQMSTAQLLIIRGVDIDTIPNRILFDCLTYFDITHQPEARAIREMRQWVGPPTLCIICLCVWAQNTKRACLYPPPPHIAHVLRAHTQWGSANTHY